MNRLQSQFYVSFPVVQAEYSMIIMDIRATARLLRNVRFINYLKQRAPQMPAGFETVDILNAIDEFHKKDRPCKLQTDESTFLPLHLNASLEFRPFVQHPEENQNNFYLMTEKFFWKWPTTNIGSGRHALLLDMQIKGIGRNPLAIRNDHAHSWGGHYLWQAMRGYIISTLYEGVTPLGILKTSYIAAKKKDLESPQIKSSAIAMAIRESDALRVTQVMTSFNPRDRGSYALILKNFLTKNRIKSLSEHMEKIIFHYSALLLMGIRHTAVTRENVTLEGTLIDYEDMKLDTDTQAYRCFIMTHKCHKKMPKGTKRFSGEALFSSTIHFYLDAIRLTSKGLSQLDPTFKMSDVECKKKFIKMIQLLGKTIFEIDVELLKFLSLLLSRDSIYDKGEENLAIKNTEANEIIKVIKSRPFEIVLTQDLGLYESNYYLVDFPRVKFKDPFIEKYNCIALMDADPLIERMFKMLQLESFAGNMGFDQMLNYSSECNKLLSQHSLIFPYKLVKGKVVREMTSKATFQKQIKLKMLKEFGVDLESFDSFKNPDTGEMIIRGAFTHLKNGLCHYTSLKPTYISK